MSASPTDTVCPLCGHVDHTGIRCSTACEDDNAECVCSYPDPSNYSTTRDALDIAYEAAESAHREATNRFVDLLLAKIGAFVAETYPGADELHVEGSWDDELKLRAQRVTVGGQMIAGYDSRDEVMGGDEEAEAWDDFTDEVDGGYLDTLAGLTFEDYLGEHSIPVPGPGIPEARSTGDDDERRVEACAFCGTPSIHSQEVQVEVEGTMDWSRGWIFLCPTHQPAPEARTPGAALDTAEVIDHNTDEKPAVCIMPHGLTIHVFGYVDVHTGDDALLYLQEEVDDEAERLALAAADGDNIIDLDAVATAVMTLGVPCFIEQTGGGVATLFAGAPSRAGAKRSEPATVAAGPAWYAGDNDTLPRAVVGDFYVHASVDDTEPTVITTTDAQTIARIIFDAVQKGTE